MNIPIAITIRDADQWLRSLPPHDDAHQTGTTQDIARLSFLAGAEAQMRRIFPHLFDASTGKQP